MERAELTLLGATVLWGLTFPAMKVSLAYLPPILFLSYRFGIATFLMLLIFREKVLKRESITEGLILGLTLFFGHGFQIVGLEYTTASNSAFITSLYVVFTPFIGYFLIGERIGGKDLVSLITALAGLYLISGANGRIGLGDALTALCALSFAFQIVLVQRFGHSDYLSLSFWQIFWNFLFSAVFSLLSEPLSVPEGLVPWTGLVYTAVFGTVVAFTLQTKYQRETTAYRAALIYSMEPIFGSLSAFLLLGESLTGKSLLGALLIMASVWNEIRRKPEGTP
ncbi:DMT family transporter [Thermococcus sp.]|uniref:DMT family transporter n=1 Tax=Thermococcus sp. TaxID=35749 RepID=UPI00262AAF5A|nr:DMT family transporter [Thermococcus sp.]